MANRVMMTMAVAFTMGATPRVVSAGLLSSVVWIDGVSLLVPHDRALPVETAGNGRFDFAEDAVRSAIPENFRKTI